jgi:hypothetical protein
MKRFAMFAVSVMFGMTLAVQPATAQMNSIPVYFSPKGGTGLLVALDLGKGINDESGKNTAVAFRSALGVGPVTIGGSVGMVNPYVNTTLGREPEAQYMGNIALRIFGGGLLPVSVSLQGGVGFMSIDDLATDVITVPIGVGFGLSVPAPAFNFEPWIAPRYTFVRSEIGAAPGINQNSFGISAGVNLGFLMGLGLHIAGDWQTNPEEFVTEGPLTVGLRETKPFVLGIGLNYTIRIPGLPGVPIVPGM